MIESVTKGTRYTNWQGRQTEAEGPGAVVDGRFVRDEEMAAHLARHGWKCQKRKGRAPDAKDSEECATQEE